MMGPMRTPLRMLASCTLVAAHLVAHAAGEVVAPGKAQPPAKAASKKKSTAPPIEHALPAAGAEQVDAAQSIYYGAYECEFQQTLAVAASAKHPAYVDVTFGKRTYLMKPVRSATGAMRLEHTKGEALLVQIAMKSMLLNVKTGQRIVDNCIGSAQRQAIEVAKRAAAEAAAQQQAEAAADAASAPVAASAPIGSSTPAAALPSIGASAPAAAPVPATVPEAPPPPAATSSPARAQ
jgi:hypothetical protein